MTRAPVVLTAVDAVVVLALVHYIDERADHGEVVTVKAAMKIAGLVSASYQESVRPLAELGLRVRRGVIRDVPDELLAQACALVLKHQTQERVRGGAGLCKGTRVVQVEQLDIDALTKGGR